MGILSPLPPHDHLFVRSCVCLCSSSHLFLLTIIFLSVLVSVSVHPLTSSSSRSSFCPFLCLSLFILSPLPPHDHLFVRSCVCLCSSSHLFLLSLFPIFVTITLDPSSNLNVR